MAISYLSKVYEATPYVLPVDLGLLARVNNYKQQQFYQNADKIGGMMSQLHNTDIANPAQRDKLVTKANNLSKQLDEAGGIDFSDKSLTNEIEGYGSEILNDPDVYRGILSTKKIRAFQSNIEKMQTDPKLSKYYNASNIARIMETQIKPYVNGDISASYDGPTAPRPYEGNPFEKMLKNMKNLPPDVTVKIGESGTPSLYKISTGEELTATDIDAAFDGLIDANTKAQLMDDAWYNFDYATGYKFDKKTGQDLYNNDHLNKARSYQTAIDAIDIRLKSETNPDTVKDLQRQRSEYGKHKQFSEGEIIKGNNEFGKMWDKDPDSAKYSLYVGKMRSDVIKAVGYSKEKVDYKVNQEWAANKKMELEAYKQGYQLNADGSYTKLPWASEGKTTKNAKGETVDANGNVVTGVTDLSYSQRTDAENELLKLDEQSINSQIGNYQGENNMLLKNFLQNFAQEKGLEGMMGYKMNVNTTVGGVAQTFSSDLISNIAGPNNILEIEDVNRIVNSAVNTRDAGLGVTVNYGGKKFGVTTDQIKALQSLQTAWQSYAEGKVDQVPKQFDGMQREWVSFAEKYQMNQININNRREYLNRVTNTALNAAGVKLSPQDKKLLVDFETGARPKVTGSRTTYSSTSMGATVANNDDVLDPEYERIIKNVDRDAIVKYKEKAFKEASKTYNYYSAILGNDKDKTDQIKKLIALKAPEDQKLNANPLAIRKTDDGKQWMVIYDYGKEGKNPKSSSIIIDNSTAAQLGIQSLAHPELEDIFAYGANETPKLSTYNTSMKQPISYKIIKTAEGGFRPGIVYQDVFYPIKSEQTPSTANAAYDLMQAVAKGQFQSMEQLLTVIKEQNSKL